MTIFEFQCLNIGIAQQQQVDIITFDDHVIRGSLPPGSLRQPPDTFCNPESAFCNKEAHVLAGSLSISFLGYLNESFKSNQGDLRRSGEGPREADLFGIYGFR